MATYRALHQHDKDFELREWEICGQDFIADLCGSVDIVSPFITFLVDLQNLQVPVWKVVIWYPKVQAHLEKVGKLSIMYPPETYVNLKANIEDIKKFEFHGEKLVEGWLRVGNEISETEDGRIEVTNWESRQLQDVENDLRQLAKDLSESLFSRLEKCLSSMQSTLTCMDIDSVLSLLVGKRNQHGYPSLAKEEEYVRYGKEDFSKFYSYICSLPHVEKLAENHIGELKLKHVYSDEILSKLKNTLKLILWTPRYIEMLSKWLIWIDVTENGEVLYVSLIDRYPIVKQKYDILQKCNIKCSNVSNISSPCMSFVYNITKLKFLIMCFYPKVKECSLEDNKDKLIKLMKFEKLESFYIQKTFYLGNLYRATFFVHNAELKTYLVRVDENEVYRYSTQFNNNLSLHYYIHFNEWCTCIYSRSFYTESSVAELLGVEMSIAIDIALALGATESIVESIYSVMKSQAMPGGQDNTTLALRSVDLNST